MLSSDTEMQRHDKPRRDAKRWQQVTMGVFGLTIVASGAIALIRGALYYESVPGFLMFAPFALIVGAAIIVLAFRLGPRP